MSFVVGDTEHKQRATIKNAPLKHASKCAVEGLPGWLQGSRQAGCWLPGRANAKIGKRRTCTGQNKGQMGVDGKVPGQPQEGLAGTH